MNRPITIQTISENHTNKYIGEFYDYLQIHIYLLDKKRTAQGLEPIYLIAPPDPHLYICTRSFLKPNYPRKAQAPTRKSKTKITSEPLKNTQ